MQVFSRSVVVCIHINHYYWQTNVEIETRVVVKETRGPQQVTMKEGFENEKKIL